MVSGVGVLRLELKIARRLSTARSCALQLSGVLFALTAMVSARRQWMILSVVVSVGTDSVGCWKTTVSEMMTADVEVLMSLGISSGVMLVQCSTPCDRDSPMIVVWSLSRGR